MRQRLLCRSASGEHLCKPAPEHVPSPKILIHMKDEPAVIQRRMARWCPRGEVALGWSNVVHMMFEECTQAAAESASPRQPRNRPRGEADAMLTHKTRIEGLRIQQEKSEMLEIEVCWAARAIVRAINLVSRRQNLGVGGGRGLRGRLLDSCPLPLLVPTSMHAGAATCHLLTLCSDFRELGPLEHGIRLRRQRGPGLQQDRHAEDRDPDELGKCAVQLPKQHITLGMLCSAIVSLMLLVAAEIGAFWKPSISKQCLNNNRSLAFAAAVTDAKPIGLPFRALLHPPVTQVACTTMERCVGLPCRAWPPRPVGPSDQVASPNELTCRSLRMTLARSSQVLGIARWILWRTSQLLSLRRSLMVAPDSVLLSCSLSVLPDA